MKRMHAQSETSGNSRFFAWLSPKPNRPQNRSRYDESDRELFSRQRSRRASFDETRRQAFQKSRQRGSYGGSNNQDSSEARDSGENSPLILSSFSADPTFDEGNTATKKSSSQPQTQSILTVLLLHLNELLPEYCEHLSTATSTSCCNGASKAIQVLEKRGNIDMSGCSDLKGVQNRSHIVHSPLP
ncbi:hypothetical protein ACHAXS_008939 [Conticribra weissflogii]